MESLRQQALSVQISDFLMRGLPALGTSRSVLHRKRRFSCWSTHPPVCCPVTFNALPHNSPRRPVWCTPLSDLPYSATSPVLVTPSTCQGISSDPERSHGSGQQDHLL